MTGTDLYQALNVQFASLRSDHAKLAERVAAFEANLRVSSKEVGQRITDLALSTDRTHSLVELWTERWDELQELMANQLANCRAHTVRTEVNTEAVRGLQARTSRHSAEVSAVEDISQRIEITTEMREKMEIEAQRMEARRQLADEQEARKRDRLWVRGGQMIAAAAGIYGLARAGCHVWGL